MKFIPRRIAAAFRAAALRRQKARYDRLAADLERRQSRPGEGWPR